MAGRSDSGSGDDVEEEDADDNLVEILHFRAKLGTKKEVKAQARKEGRKPSNWLRRQIEIVLQRKQRSP